MKSLIKLGLLLVGGILVYNFFFGTPQEKEQSRQIFTEVKDLTQSAVQLLKTEKEKFDEGKYDEALDKIGGLIDNLKNKAELLEENKDIIDQIADLKQQKNALENKVRETKEPSEYGNEGQRMEPDSAEKAQLEEDWDKLIRETKGVMDQMERRAQ